MAISTENKKPYVSFLGGDDSEMSQIKKHIMKFGFNFFDKGLSWGAKASDYKDEILQTAKEGKIPVLIELEVDIELPETAVVIDHHGARSGEPPAIIQFLSLASIEQERNDVLIGAMDAGFVFGLESIGAKNEEIANFLGIKDDSSKMSIKDMLLKTENGFGDDIIIEAEKAVKSAEIIGNLIVVRCSHSKCGPITTRLLGEQDFQNVVVFSNDGEVNYFGAGESIQKVNSTFSGGWSGGAGLMPPNDEAKKFWTQWGGNAPKSAFWGGYPNHEEFLTFLIANFS